METSPMTGWLDKALGMISRAQDEIVKVSHLGKTHINRSFLLHERSKLFRKMGELAYRLVKEGKLESSELTRLVEHVDRLSKKVEEVEGRMKDLTAALSHKMDAEHETDVVKKRVSGKKIRIKKKKEI